MSEAPEVYIGVDIGGTKVAAGLVNPQGEILHKTRTPMHARGTADASARLRASRRRCDTA